MNTLRHHSKLTLYVTFMRTKCHRKVVRNFSVFMKKTALNNLAKHKTSI